MTTFPAEWLACLTTNHEIVGSISNPTNMKIFLSTSRSQLPSYLIGK